MSRNAFQRCEREYNKAMEMIDISRAERLAADLSQEHSDDGTWPCSGKGGKCENRVEADGDYCEDCKQEVDKEDDGYCTYCAGSGEGQHDGTRCPSCKGRGVIQKPSEDY